MIFKPSDFRSVSKPNRPVFGPPSGFLVGIFVKPYAGYLPYCASKAALIAINKGLAKALAPQVQVNAILPGPILWPEKDKGENQKAILKKTPLGRMGSPLDIAAAIRFFIEGSDFATGSELHVDGGRHID